MKRYLSVVGILLVSSVLSACFHSHDPKDSRYSVCKELNRQIVLNGATSNPRTADIQRIERGRLIQAYDNNQCSGSW